MKVFPRFKSVNIALFRKITILPWRIYSWKSYYLGYPVIYVYNVSFIGFVYMLEKICKETLYIICNLFVDSIRINLVLLLQIKLFLMLYHKIIYIFTCWGKVWFFSFWKSCGYSFKKCDNIKCCLGKLRFWGFKRENESLLHPKIHRKTLWWMNNICENVFLFKCNWKNIYFVYLKKVFKMKNYTSCIFIAELPHYY